MFYKYFYLFRAMLKILFSLREILVGSNIKVKGWCDFKIEDTFGILHERHVTEMSTFFMKAPDSVLNQNIKAQINESQVAFSRGTSRTVWFESAYDCFLETNKPSSMIKFLMKRQLKNINRQ